MREIKFRAWEKSLKQIIPKEIREELSKRLEPMKDKIRRGEIEIGGGEDEQS